MGPDEIRAIRTALGLTQGQLAGRMGVHWRTVQKWEGGERRPRGPADVLLRRLAAEGRRRRPHAEKYEGP